MAADPMFLPPSEFTAADDLVNWQPVGKLSAMSRSGNVFTFSTGSARPAPQLTFLTPHVFRLRFNARGDYSRDHSYAVLPQAQRPAFPPASPLSLTVAEN